MKSGAIHLPVFQKFSCHACGFCCRNLVVNVTEEERRRILDGGWGERMGGVPLFVSYRYRGRKLRRLAHGAGGACVFLAEDGRCRLHKEAGARLKPLACRMYPFVLTPGAGSVRLDMRADCPSVAANKGQPLAAYEEEIAGLAEETHMGPMGTEPQWKGGKRLLNREFALLAETFEGLLSQTDRPIGERLRAGSALLDLLYAVRIDKIRDERFGELLHMLKESVVEEAAEQTPAAVSGRAGRLFRQWLFLHALADAPADLEVKGLAWYGRWWARYRQARRFGAGVGAVPRVGPDWPATTFEAVAGVKAAADEHLEPLCRSMRVKLEAHAFCGPGYYGQDVITGLTALWLLPALVGWFARLQAVGAGRTALAAEDVLEGVRRAHHTFGVSGVFTRISERLRLQAFARPGVVGALVAQFGP
jgi:lysine-N-methylase